MLTCSAAAFSQEAGTVSMELSGGSSVAEACLLDTPVFKDNKILLRWKYSGRTPPDFYIIERSSDERQFQTVGVLRPNDDNISFRFVDEGPAALKNFYRIKAGSATGPNFYSVTVAVEGPGFICKIYPNPADKILIIRSDIEGELRVHDGGNRQRMFLPVQRGLQSMDVSRLEKGFYIITIIDKLSHKIYREKLIKD